MALLADPYRYISSNARRLRTDLFETRLFLRRTICLTGPDATDLFYDDARFRRSGAAPLPLQDPGPGGRRCASTRRSSTC